VACIADYRSGGRSSIEWATTIPIEAGMLGWRGTLLNVPTMGPLMKRKKTAEILSSLDEFIVFERALAVGEAKSLRLGEEPRLFARKKLDHASSCASQGVL
jgi:hypothetical protein